MNYKQKNGKAIPNDIQQLFEEAAKKYETPVGLLLATCECESNFRLGLVSAAGAVGPMQLKKKYADDFYRYAGFSFALETWDSVAGVAAILHTYAKQSHLDSPYSWRWALCAFRWGAKAPQMREYATCKRVTDVETHMRRNGLWYDDDVLGDEKTAEKQNGTDDRNGSMNEAKTGTHDETQSGNGDSATIYAQTAEKAADWACKQIGLPYSQPNRAKEGWFDCSSLVARAYKAVGVSLKGGGLPELPTSNYEVYADCFELLWPEDYAKIGKKYGGKTQIALADKPGDLQFICTNSKTSRDNRITHVTMVCDKTHIVHAKGTKYGVVKTPITDYSGKICALVRYNPDGQLRKFMRGNRVLELQKKLNAMGEKLEEDGVYGTATEKAVKKHNL